MPLRLVAELNKAGFTSVREVIPDGDFHRFNASTGNHRDTKDSGYYVAFRNILNKTNEEFYVMLYGSWYTGEQATFNTLAGIKLDKFERRRVDEQMEKAKRKREQQRLQLAKEAQLKAEEKFNSLNDDFIFNEYLKSKNLQELFGARVDGKQLVVPMRDTDGVIHNLERIYKNIGEEKFQKRGLFGGRRDGLFHQIGEMSDVVYVTEGFSTAIAVHLATEECVIATFNAGNLPKVLQELIRKDRNKKYVICGDNDQFNEEKAGALKAEEAAQVSEESSSSLNSKTWKVSRQIFGI